MSNLVTSNRWIASMLIVAMVGFASLVFADSGAPTKKTAGATAVNELRVASDLDGVNPSGDHAPAIPSTVLAAPPANDTCAGAIPLELNRTFIFTNAEANDDYQTPDTAACYSGIGQQPTKAQGRDVVFSFAAPADGKYTFANITFYPNDPSGGVAFNPVLYLTDCANSGTVNCIRGTNRGNPPRGFTTGASNGFNNGGNSEAIECVPMTAGQTHYLVYDDRATGKCSPSDPGAPAGFRLSNCYQDSDCLTPGAVCNPVLNAGGRMMVEVRPCNSEVEPNDTPATANPYVCGLIAETHVRPNWHCLLGTRAGQVCTRSVPLPQDHPDSKMVCSITGGRCSYDTVSGISTCPGGITDLCQAQVDADCDPRCDIGPNAGKTCGTQAFCNPVSDQGATCVGSCTSDFTCVNNVTGANTGVVCSPVCVGSATQGVTGRVCSALTGCPGGGVCTQTVTVPAPGGTCQVGETCSRVYNEGDTDFFSLGVVPSGSAVYAAVVASPSNDGDYRMRVTTDTQTLQFDDDDGVSRANQSTTTIGGALGTGVPTYIEVSKSQFRESAPYELWANVVPPLAQAQEEENPIATGNDHYFYWPGDILSITPINNGANNGFVRGTFAYNGDSDCFKFLVNEGDMMNWIGAANPQRTAGPITLVDWPNAIIYDANPGVSDFFWNGNARKNTNPGVPQPTLKATSPAVTSMHLQWRATYTGMVEVCWLSTSQLAGLGVPAYPNNWAAIMTSNCGPVQAAGPGTTTTDVSVVKVLTTPGPITSGDIVEYTITVTNNGSQIAQEVVIDETLDPNLTFISLAVDDGFDDAHNTFCPSLPSPGTNDAPISCLNASMAPGTTTTYTLTVQVNNCIVITGDGVAIDNYVVLTQVSTDPNPDNDYSTASFTAVPAPNNGCTDLVCDFQGCVPNLCTQGDTCQAGVCVPGSDPGCNDNNVCTEDSCDPAVGCINDDSAANLACDDLNDCTINSCDPILFCVFENEPPTTPCYDGNPCTFEDYCDGQGTCGGTSVCDDSNDCTDDFTQAGTCVCTHANTVSGSPCSDNNACTGAPYGPDACDGAGVCVGGLPPCIDDANPCTVDTCDPDLGCLNTPVECAPPDQCHSAGVCDFGSGNCDYAPLPNGTTCDDGDSGTTGDVCTGGVCTGGPACDTQPTPKPEGYYKRLCKGGVNTPHAGDAITDADAVCVGQLTDTFAGITTANEVCAEWGHDTNHHDTNGPESKECDEKAERELMALALNICRDRVCPSQEVDSNCGSDPHDHTLTTVQESLDTVDDILSDPARNKTTCKNGKCLAKEINNGKALHHTSLVLSKVVGQVNKVRLTWDSPVFEDGSGEASNYTIWRRVLNADDVFVKLTETTNLTYVDTTAETGTYEYEVTFTIEP